MLLKHMICLAHKINKHNIIKRGIKQNVDATGNGKFTEFKFQVSWGTIRGKLWGSIDKQPIVALHGWLDNSGSFDLLAPLIKKSSILAIDLPGQGLSSWLPKGVPYNEDVFMILLRTLVDQHGWNKIKLLGHSWGGIHAYNYTRLFPEETEFVITLDALGPIALDVEKQNQYRKRGIMKFLEYEKKLSETPRSYSMEEVIQRRMKANKFSKLDLAATQILLKRGISKQTDDKYTFNRDYRLTIEGFEHFYTKEMIKKFPEFITCPLLCVKSTKSAFGDHSYWTDIPNILKKSSKDFRLKIVEGDHHVHLMNPQPVADEINSFLLEYDK